MSETKANNKEKNICHDIPSTYRHLAVGTTGHLSLNYYAIFGRSGLWFDLCLGKVILLYLILSQIPSLPLQFLTLFQSLIASLSPFGTSSKV